MCRLCGSVAPKGSTAACQRCCRTKAWVCSARILSRTWCPPRAPGCYNCFSAMRGGLAMQANGTPVHLDDPSLYFNRELSWLEFNRRVLEETQDPTVPLLERLKFAAIFESNLDEFFMVRVGGLQQKVQLGIAY